MQLRSTLVLALALGVLLPGVARADAPRALMMAPLGDADAVMKASAVAEVRATLEHQGVVFITPPRGLSLECETLQCRAAAATAAGAIMAVTVLVWQPTSFRPEGRVEVALTDVAGETVGAEEDFAADETLAAVQAARAAFARFGTQGRVALEVTGTEGAAVLVDGRPVGAVPYRGSLASGPHRIRVVANGEVLLTRELVVEQGAEPILLRVAPPVADEGTDDEDTRPARAANPALLASGVGLTVAGAGAVAWVVAEVARSGCSARNGAGECTQERVLQRGPAVAVGVLGAVALTTGITLALRSRARPGSGVSVSLAPTNASLRVAF
ncbi:MAG: PEGA domain-containing protein [Myxococcales bacterium]|nr:PEGA domain-containing protein [Myxococcales bacterium]